MSVNAALSRSVISSVPPIAPTIGYIASISASGMMPTIGGTSCPTSTAPGMQPKKILQALVSPVVRIHDDHGPSPSPNRIETSLSGRTSSLRSATSRVPFGIQSPRQSPITSTS